MKLLRNDFFLTLIILALYLVTNRYIYAWDDQHLEIPMLKHLIDPALYRGDYYVESLAKNFSSFLYPLLAKLIKVSQVPAVYMFLFLIVRYTMFFWVFRLWQLISGEKSAAFCATVMFFVLGRTEEFLYRTFSHQEFSIAFMMAGIYFFWKERYYLAAFIFGVGANIHAIYNLLPMLYMLSFLAFFTPRRWPTALKAGLIFTLTCLPFILWQVPRSLVKLPISAEDWIPLYLLSCPQNFVFGDTPLVKVLSNLPLLVEKCASYLLLTGLYLFHCIFNPQMRQDKKAHALIWTAWLLIVVSYYFTYVHPSRSVIDLNLVRNEQYVRFLFMGYSTVFIWREIKTAPAWLCLLYGIAFASLAIGNLMALAVFMALSIVLLIRNYIQGEKRQHWVFISAACVLGTLLFLLATQLKHYEYPWERFDKYLLILVALIVCAVGLYFKPRQSWLRRCFVIIPLVVMFASFCMVHYYFVQNRARGAGFWQMQRNWEDMQYYAHDHIPKDALILTPYNTDLGGFRIRSERKVLVCYRDCGIIGFDFAAGQEWQRRVKDIEGFKMITNQSVDQAVVNAILKYHVDYIVFMNYYQPAAGNPVLKKLYQNEVFALYQVMLKN